MNKQRKFILIICGAGIVAMFLPWIDLFLVSRNGMHGKGILVFLSFLICGIIALMGDQTKPLEQAMWMIVMITSGLIALGMIIWFLRAIEVLELFSIGYYMALIASVLLPLAAFNYRASGYNFKNGFESLKKTISDKTNTGNPSN